MVSLSVRDGMSQVSLRARLPHYLAISLTFLYCLALPDKRALLHGVSVLLLAMLFAARGNGERAPIWRESAWREYVLLGGLWLIPVVVASVSHALRDLPGAATPADLVKFLLRIFGLGLAFIVMVRRGWLTLTGFAYAAGAALAIHALAGYAQWLFSERIGGELLTNYINGGNRVTGLVFNPNPFGQIMSLGVLLGAASVLACRRSVAAWALLLLCIPMVYASGSRGAALATLAGAFFLWPLRLRTILPLIGVALGFVLAYYMNWGWLTRHGTGDSARIDALLFAFHHWCQAPFFGWGFEAFLNLPSASLPVAASAHNIVADLALACGVFALLAWMLSSGRLVWALERTSSPASRLMLALFVALLVAGQFDYSLLTATIYQGCWMLVTALSCLILTSVAERADC